VSATERDKLAELISCHDSYGYFEDERGSGSECSCGTEICPGLEYAPAAHVGHLTDVILAAGYQRLDALIEKAQGECQRNIAGGDYDTTPVQALRWLHRVARQAVTA
jgi:hypothetical protein